MKVVSTYNAQDLEEDLEEDLEDLLNRILSRITKLEKDVSILDAELASMSIVVDTKREGNN